MAKRAAMAAVACCWWWTAAAAQVPRVPKVIVVGIDGLSVDGVNTAKTPNLHRLMARAA